MTPELEVLEQILDGDLPMNVIADLFSDLDHCRDAIGAMLKEDEVHVVDATRQPIPEWRYRELASTTDFWSVGTRYRLSITDKGAQRIG